MAPPTSQQELTAIRSANLRARKPKLYRLLVWLKLLEPVPVCVSAPKTPAPQLRIVK